MLKTLILILSLLIQFAVVSQDSLQRFIDNKCHYKIDGSGEAKGIKMQIDIPCEWDSLQENRPALVKSYIYKVKDDNYLGAFVLILKTGYTPTQKEIDSTNFDNFFDQASWGRLISSRKVNVDALNCTEAHTFNLVNLPQGQTYQNMLSYLLVYKDYFVVVAYKAMAFDEADSHLLFNQYRRLFQALAAGTVLYNHWTFPTK